MRMTCPGCGAEFTLDVLIAHEGAREALAEAMGLNLAIGKRLVAYMSLFRPPHRQLTMDRVAKILKEISPCIKNARITRNGRDWVIPLESWSWALEEIVAKKDKLTLPLKSHGYLFEMLIAAADRVEGAQEQAIETRRQSGGLQTGQTVVARTQPAEAMKPAAALVVKAAPMPEETRLALRNLKNKTGGI